MKEEIATVIDSNLATKHDIQRLEKEIEILSNKLTIRLGGMLVIAVGILSVIIKLGH